MRVKLRTHRVEIVELPSVHCLSFSLSVVVSCLWNACSQNFSYRYTVCQHLLRIEITATRVFRAVRSETSSHLSQPNIDRNSCRIIAMRCFHSVTALTYKLHSLGMSWVSGHLQGYGIKMGSPLTHHTTSHLRLSHSPKSFSYFNPGTAALPSAFFCIPNARTARQADRRSAHQAPIQHLTLEFCSLQ